MSACERGGADGEFPIPALPFLGPVAGAAMVPVEIELLVSAQRYRRVVRRRVLDGLLGRSDSDRVIEPTYFPDPLRRNEYLVTQPPVARVYHQVPNGPGFLIDQQVLHVADAAIARFDVIVHHCLAAAQVRVAILIPGGFKSSAVAVRLHPILFGMEPAVGAIHQHHARGEAITPGPDAAPIGGVAIVPKVAHFVLPRDGLVRVDVGTVLHLFLRDRDRQRFSGPVWMTDRER